VPAIDKLLTSPDNATTVSRIAGFVSLDYRLSPHPAFPQDPETVPGSKLRNARHPDHIRDIWTALSFLQKRYAIGRPQMPYVIYGHSAGATLGLQVIMGEEAQRTSKDDRVEGLQPSNVKLPVAVVGFEGVYDLRGLNERMGDAYAELWNGAFGENRDEWDRVSPAKFAGSFRNAWHRRENPGGLVILAASPEDELVDMQELNEMERKLQADRQPVVAFRDLKGRHDEIVDDGTYVARVLRQTVEQLDGLRSG
jgi:kynurenine formamidase